MLTEIAYGLFLIGAMVGLTWIAFFLSRIVTDALLGPPLSAPPDWLDTLIPLAIFTIWLAAAVGNIGLSWYPLSGALFSAALSIKLWKEWWR